MAHIAGRGRAQTLLLPESLDDYVGAENPVRFIKAFVDGLDLTAAGFLHVTPKRTGRPGYDPTDLPKLYIYGYLNRVRSSRQLEAETHRNIEVIWLLVNTEHKLVVEQQVTNQVIDMGLLTQTAEAAKEVLEVDTIDAVANNRYFTIKDSEACEKAGIVLYVPRPQRGPLVKAGLFRMDEFRYDVDSDVYVCSAGQRLHPHSSSFLCGLKKIN